MPPPGVEAARPPTERTLQPVDRSQTRERVRSSRDCHKETTELRAQYRLQVDGLNTWYAPKLAAAQGAARDGLRQERDARLATVRRQADVAVKRLADSCRADNAGLLHSPVSPAELR